MLVCKVCRTQAWYNTTWSFFECHECNRGDIEVDIVTEEKPDAE